MRQSTVGAVRYAACVCAMACVFQVSAGEVNLQGLASGSSHQRFIVSYKDRVAHCANR